MSRSMLLRVTSIVTLSLALAGVAPARRTAPGHPGSSRALRSAASRAAQERPARGGSERRSAISRAGPGSSAAQVGEWAQRRVWLAGVSRRVWIPAKQSSRPGTHGALQQKRGGRYTWIHERGRYALQPVRVHRAGARGRAVVEEAPRGAS